MTLAELALGAGAFALTYLVHSTLLLGAAWLVTRRESALAPRLRERLWRTAALGGLLTAGLQLGLDWRPIGGAWHLAPATATSAATLAEGEFSLQAPVADVELPLAQRAEAAQAAGALHLARLDARKTDRFGAPLAFGTDLDALPPRATNEQYLLLRSAPDADAGSEELFGVASGRTGESSALPAVIVRWLFAPALLLWIGVAFVALLRLARAAQELRDRLRGGLPLTGGPLQERLTALGAPRSLELVVCPALASPITTGILRPRICLPLRALTDLSPAAQECMLAHELAHVRRADAAWLLGFSLLQALLPFQPLNRLARRQAADAAEYLCDDWAVERTGRSLELARCLTEVAGWVVGNERQALATVGMAGRASTLGRRVERLVVPSRRARFAGSARLWTPVLLLGLAAVAAAAPGVGPRAAGAEPEEQAQHESTERVAAPPIESSSGLEQEQHAGLEPSAVLLREFPSPSAKLALRSERAAKRLPLPDPAPDPRLVAGLLQVFSSLDLELSTLEAEFELLATEVRAAGLEQEFASTLEGFLGHVRHLRERRDTARERLTDLARRASLSAPVSGALRRS